VENNLVKNLEILEKGYEAPPGKVLVQHQELTGRSKIMLSPLGKMERHFEVFWRCGLDHVGPKSCFMTWGTERGVAGRLKDGPILKFVDRESVPSE
jgi:hypothetical protein